MITSRTISDSRYYKDEKRGFWDEKKFYISLNVYILPSAWILNIFWQKEICPQFPFNKFHYSDKRICVAGSIFWNISIKFFILKFLLSQSKDFLTWGSNNNCVWKDVSSKSDLQNPPSPPSCYEPANIWSAKFQETRFIKLFNQPYLATDISFVAFGYIDWLIDWLID